jgi:hypothetical protein
MSIQRPQRWSDRNARPSCAVILLAGFAGLATLAAATDHLARVLL